VDLHAGCFADGVAGFELAAVLVWFAHDGMRARIPWQDPVAGAHTYI
jgi:hypothetical protein